MGWAKIKSCCQWNRNGERKKPNGNTSMTLTHIGRHFSEKATINCCRCYFKGPPLLKTLDTRNPELQSFWAVRQVTHLLKQVFLSGLAPIMLLASAPTSASAVAESLQEFTPSISFLPLGTTEHERGKFCFVDISKTSVKVTGPLEHQRHRLPPVGLGASQVVFNQPVRATNSWFPLSAWWLREGVNVPWLGSLSEEFVCFPLTLASSHAILFIT